MAQVILSAIAASIMTVVSIVFAILLMTLTLASTQFSPRILVSFVRDRGTQWTLGIFLGTFSYCMAALPAARSLPPVLAGATVTGAMLLALCRVGWLIFFIHHISQAISVNHIVDRIARETELVIDDFMPDPHTFELSAGRRTMTDEPRSRTRSPATSALSTSTVCSIWRRLAYPLRVERGVGHFVPAGVALFLVSRGSGSIRCAARTAAARSISDRRARCSRTSSSGSSRSSTSRSRRSRPRSTIRAPRSPASTSSDAS